MNISYYKPPDEAFYSLIFLYRYDIVTTKHYDYTTFKFKIWDLFNNFLEKDN